MLRHGCDVLSHDNSKFDPNILVSGGANRCEFYQHFNRSFFCESEICNFSLLMYFLAKVAACIILVKLSTGVNFTKYFVWLKIRKDVFYYAKKHSNNIELS